VEQEKAAKQTFEVVFWDGAGKKQLQDLHKEEEGELHQLLRRGPL